MLNIKRVFNVRTLTLFIASIWTIGLAASVIWNNHLQTREVKMIVKEAAKSLLLTDISYLNWNASHGGVYVEVIDSSNTKSNRKDEIEEEIVTPSGRKLILVSPPEMSKQIRIPRQKNGFCEFRIAGIDPFEAENKADSLERIAIDLFLKGEKEFEFIQNKGGESYYRLIEPLFINDDCLKCHSNEGYKVGDIKGSVSITIPMSRYANISSEYFSDVIARHLIIWIGGLLLLFISSRTLNKYVKERELVQVNLLETEERYRDLIEKAGIAVAISDKNGNYVYFNEKFSQLFGYTFEEIKEKPIDLLIHPLDIERIKSYQLAWRQNEYAPSRYEFRGIKKDGSIFYLETDVTLQKNDGEFVGTLEYIWDITERKEMEKALQKSEKRYRPVVSSMSDIIFILDADDVFIDVFYGKSEDLYLHPEEFIGKRLQSLMPLHISEIYTKHAKKLRETGKVQKYEYSLEKNNEVTWFTAILNLYGDNGSIIANVIETTELKKTEEALLKSEKNLIEAQRIAHLGHWENDYLTGENSRSEELYNIFNIDPNSKNVTNESFYKVIHPEDRDKVKDVFNKSLQNKQDYEITYRLLFDNNTIKYVFEKGINEFDNEGNPVRSIGIVQDITAQKEAEKALKESEERYRRLFEQLPEGIVIDVDGIIQLANPAALKIIKAESAQEVIGKSVYDFIHPDYHELVKKRREEGATNANISSLIEEKIIRIDGKVIDVEVIGVHIEYKKQKAVQVIFRDITEKKKMLETNTKLLTALEQSPISIIITDINGYIEYVNSTFTSITGYSRDEVIGKKPNILKSGKYGNKFYEELWGTISSGGHWQGEMLNRKKNGELYWEEVILIPIKDNSGKIIKYCALKTDITKQKKLNEELEEYRKNLEMKVEERTEALRKSEETFRALSESSSDLIIRVDREFRILYVNPAVLKSTGMTADKYLEHKLSELDFPKELLSLWEHEINRVFESGKEKRIESQFPNATWVDWSLVPERDEDGNITAVITSGRDVTEMKNLEDKIRKALEKEKELNNLKTQFINTVAHEFKTPLTAIYSTVDLCERYKDKIDEEKRQSYFSRIKHSVNRLNEMVEELLTLSRFESGKIKLAICEIDIKNIIDKLVLNHNNILKKGQVIVKKYQLQNNVFYLDKNVLEHILNNLLNNASKYSDEGTQIEIVVKELKNKLRIEVRDQGQGIPDEDKKHIFEPFYRAKNSHAIKGTGLGLAIVKEYISLLNGNIFVKDNENVGTIFRIEIPQING